MFLVKIFIILCKVLLIWGQPNDNPYCKYTCHDTNANLLQHTLCSVSCSPAFACGDGHYLHPTNDEKGDEFRQNLLDMHNKIRWKVAIGSFNKSLGLASDMNVLRYNRELEFMAKCHANRCASYGTYDQCRTTETIKNSAQNYFTHYFPALKNIDPKDFEQNPSAYALLGLEVWQTELYHVTRDMVKHAGHYRSFDSRVRNMINILGANLTHMGCAMSRSALGRKFNIYLYCNYGPIPEDDKIPLYSVGPPCYLCKSKHMECNRKAYFGLCGPNIDVHREDPFEDPFSF